MVAEREARAQQEEFFEESEPRKRRQVVFFNDREWVILNRLAQAHALSIGQYIRMVVAVNAIEPERRRVQAAWEALEPEEEVNLS
jgi:hypothetical protein